MSLKTNYEDAVLDVDVNTKRRYNVIRNMDGTVSLEDVTTYIKKGSDFGANDINNTNNAIKQIGAELLAEDNLKFQFTKSGNDYGYKDSNGNFRPFRKVQASKTVTAGTSAKTVSPDSGYHGIASVTVNPQPHTATRATVTSNGTIDLGANHATRYVPVNVPRYNFHYLGEYASDATINISSLGATSASQFLLVCDTAATGWHGSWNLLRDYNRVSASDYYPPSITSFSTNSLTISVGKVADYIQTDDDGHPISTAYIKLKTKVYYVGNAL